MMQALVDSLQRLSEDYPELTSMTDWHSAGWM